MKIDTSTTAGKIQVMQAFEDGKAIQWKESKGWVPCVPHTPCWDWAETDYRIKPQAVEEAAEDCKSICRYRNAFEWRKIGFIAGAKWREENPKEDQ